MTEKDKLELMRRFEPFGREIPKDQVMSVIARVPTESSESEKHQLSEETPTNTSTDLISRAETVKRLLLFKQSRAKSVSRYDMGFVDGLSHAINILDLVPLVYIPSINIVDLAPSADRPKGEWKCMSDCGVTECDQCGWSIEEYVGDYNFCPNCGTDMSGEVIGTEMPLQKWIPVSERLPNIEQDVLATTTLFGTREVTFAWRINDGEWLIREGSSEAANNDILAWMPLPEPYKGGEDE